MIGSSGSRSSESAAAQWAAALGAWTIREDILSAAPTSPWVLSPGVLRRRVAEFSEMVTSSRERALEALPPGGRVLDVGVGAGAASLPLARRANLVVGVDEKEDMLKAFVEEASTARVACQTVLGRWPDVARSAPPADVVVCHHVFYNVPDLVSFVRALSVHAQRRVVAEITESHPMGIHNDLWLKFHGIRRPTRPTAADAVEVIREAGFAPNVELWVRPRATRFETRADLVAFVRTRLCLTESRDAEIDDLLEADADVTPRGVATIWWDP